MKVESSPAVAPTIKYLVERGIPVMGHVGLRPQAVNVDGGFKAKGRSKLNGQGCWLKRNPTAEAGAFAIVVEGVAAPLAPEITAAVEVPTIGIGASAACDGQVLVVDDMLGLFDWTPKFVRRYADMKTLVSDAAASYAADVRARRFPAAAETYALAADGQKPRVAPGDKRG